MSGLFVISNSSAVTYNDKQARPQQVAQDLGVCNMVLGRVRGTRSNLSVAIELIDGFTGATIWRKKFAEGSSNKFAPKQDITRSSAQHGTSDGEEAYMFWYRATRVRYQAPSPDGYDFARAMAESPQNPGFIGTMMCRAAAHTQVGNDAIARAIAAQLLQKAPK